MLHFMVLAWWIDMKSHTTPQRAPASFSLPPSLGPAEFLQDSRRRGTLLKIAQPCIQTALLADKSISAFGPRPHTEQRGQMAVGLSPPPSQRLQIPRREERDHSLQKSVDSGRPL